jgi:hypothetical protein
MPIFTATYHASGFAYKEDVETDTLEQAEVAASTRLEAPQLRGRAGERVLVLLTAQVGAVQVEPKAAAPPRLPATPDQMPGERRGPVLHERPGSGTGEPARGEGRRGRGGNEGPPGRQGGRRGDPVTARRPAPVGRGVR